MNPRSTNARVWPLLSLLVVALTLFSGCQTVDWRQRLAAELPVLGHRNWIVIADSAYPAQSGQGIETIYTGNGQLEVVREVLAALDKTKHVKPVIYLDAELSRVPDALAPGVEKYRSDLKQLLGARAAQTRPHMELIQLLDRTGTAFRVLILKTDLVLPYTSVFLELDCGYWGPEQEKKLREAIGRGN